MVLVRLHALASFTVIVYVPVPIPVKIGLLWNVPPMEYVYAGIPPLAVIVSTASLPGTQLGIVDDTLEINNGDGSVILIEELAVQLFAS
jgi:hypothetical protein